MSNSTYDQFDAAFKHVTAYAILDSAGEYIARACFKYPADGAGRLYCYFQMWGAGMVRGYASGGGYDKQSAAVQMALGKWRAMERAESAGDYPIRPAVSDIMARIESAMAGQGGRRWADCLERAGFRVVALFG